MQPVRTVPCPRCGTAAPFSRENKWRPFCSERCKMIDLGDWAAEKFRVPVEDAKADPDSESADPESGQGH